MLQCAAKYAGAQKRKRYTLPCGFIGWGGM